MSKFCGWSEPRNLIPTKFNPIKVAPTGAASVLLPDGRTVHSKTPPPQTMKKKEFSTAQLTDYPMSDAALRKLRAHTGTHVDNLKLICLNLDERVMWSNRLVAWCSKVL